MASKQPNARRQPQAHATKVVQKQGNKLPDYLVNTNKVDDLRAAVAIYETEDQPGVIQMNYVRGIL